VSRQQQRHVKVTAESTEELSEQQLDLVTGGFVIYGRPAQEHAIQRLDPSSALLGGPDTKVGFPTGGG
jgi:hypothetical protein